MKIDNDLKMLAFIMLCLFVTYLVIDYFFVYSHERIHEAVARNFGCNSTIKIHFSPKQLAFSGTTTPINCSLTPSEHETYRILQSSVDAQGYQFFPLLLAIVTVPIFVLIYNYYLKK